jgi:hypothetical protein
MSKRPSIIDRLDLQPTAPAKKKGKAPAATATAEVVNLKEATEKAAKARDVQHTSVYIPRAAYERLREIAFHERKKIHDLIMEGVDGTIAARGHSESASRKAKAS